MPTNDCFAPRAVGRGSLRRPHRLDLSAKLTSRSPLGSPVPISDGSSDFESNNYWRSGPYLEKGKLSTVGVGGLRKRTARYDGAPIYTKHIRC